MKKKSIWRKLYEWEGSIGPGEFFDGSTYRGCWRFLGVSIIGLYAMWHAYDFLTWFEEDLLGRGPYTPNSGQRSWSQLWAIIIGGSGMLTALFSIFVIIPLKHRRARKSTKGQWFDRPDLTREELYGNTSGQPEETECK